ncbi:MAG: PspC domain-containing protein [Flavobacteriaceae bacterium]|nr:PspC domain-containing protein [Flavobacteriaceae bacterium]
MNKTVNINLANTFFHIDEDAYLKLQRYLQSIKRSFENTPGEEEIIADIEARIAELFSERKSNDTMVITNSIVEEVINIMGQPEDYAVDEDIFEDEVKPKSASRTKSKKFFRDPDNKYIAGVSAGIGHYLNIDPLWIRILWILVVVSGFGSPIIIYILLWILIPEATTTSEKIAMTGDPVTISNIEKKVKEGLDNVTSTIKDGTAEVTNKIKDGANEMSSKLKEGAQDINQKMKEGDYANKVKQNGKNFFDSIGDIFLLLFKVFGKFIGILLIIIGGSSLIGLFVGLTTAGVADMVHVPGFDFVNVVNSSAAPIWLISLIAFFAFGIPFFFLFYLGLKILVNNLKSIGNFAKFALLGLWIAAVIGLIVLGLKQAASYAYTSSSTDTHELVFNQNEPLVIEAMELEDAYPRDHEFDMDGFHLITNEDGEDVLYSESIRLIIKPSKDETAYLKIRKDADGSSFKHAASRAKAVMYNFELHNNKLRLDEYLTTLAENKFGNQKVYLSLYLPRNSLISFNELDDIRLRRIPNNMDYSYWEMDAYNWKLNEKGILECLDCEESPVDQEETELEEEKENRIRIDKDGVDIKVKKNNGEDFKMKIDQDGVEIDSL